jgi:hypothetical protein
MQALVKFRRHHVKSFAILLLIVATLSLQAAPLTSHHSNDDVTHGCVFCHFAHMAWANPAEALGVLAPVHSEWHIAVHKSSGYRETLLVIGHSRAPPA